MNEERSVKNIIACLIHKNNKTKFIINKILSITSLNDTNMPENKYTVIGENRLKLLLDIEKRFILIRDMAIKAIEILKRK